MAAAGERGAQGGARPWGWGGVVERGDGVDKADGRGLERETEREDGRATTAAERRRSV